MLLHASRNYIYQRQMEEQKEEEEEEDSEIQDVEEEIECEEEQLDPINLKKDQPRETKDDSIDNTINFIKVENADI